jgi:hypothetical protein
LSILRAGTPFGLAFAQLYLKALIRNSNRAEQPSINVIFYQERKMFIEQKDDFNLVQSTSLKSLTIVLLGAMGLLNGCGTKNSLGSEVLASKPAKDSSIRDLCLPTDGFCHEVIHAANGVHFAYTDGKLLGILGTLLTLGSKTKSNSPWKPKNRWLCLSIGMKSGKPHL